MFFHDGGKLQYEVRVTKPDPLFAKALQQAIGGIQGEIRVALQYLFQAWGARGPAKYRSLLLDTGAEEIGHIEMLATAVALNLEGAPLEMDKAAQDPVLLAALGGMNIQHAITSCLVAMPIDANGVPFNCSHVYATGNIAHDLLANATAEASGRMLAVQLYRMTDDPGMKDMLSFLIARDTMHQNQWMAAWEEAGGRASMPIPNNFPQELENNDVNYSFFATGKDSSVPVAQGAWSDGTSFDGKGTFKTVRLEAGGTVPAMVGDPRSAVQKEQHTT